MPIFCNDKLSSDQLELSSKIIEELELDKKLDSNYGSIASNNDDYSKKDIVNSIVHYHENEKKGRFGIIRKVKSDYKFGVVAIIPLISFIIGIINLILKLTSK